MGELEPEPWFMGQNCFQKKKKKKASSWLKRELCTGWTPPESEARILRAPQIATAQPP